MEKKQQTSEFEELKTGVKELLGFNVFQYKDSYIGRRFDSRLRAYHLESYDAYWELLKRDEKEQEKLLQELTINVTEFFRDPPVFEILRQQVIPRLLQKSGRIRVWSAGSSDGKEAYSLAMLFNEALGEQRAAARVEILGTDIDADCLVDARLGRYESHPGITQTDVAKQLRFLAHPEQFLVIEGNQFQVKPAVKSMVRFEYHDLISGPKKRNIDIILCRNVVIYFTRELQEVLYQDFFNALNPGGFFVMGKTETLVGPSRTLFTPFNLMERIYQKT